MQTDFTRQTYLDVHTLVADPLNPKIHPQSQIDALKADLEEFGQQAPIRVRDKDGAPMIVAGHGLATAIQQLAKHNLKKWGMAWVLFVPHDWSEEKARGFMVADNRIPELGQTNNQTLVDVIDQYTKVGYDLNSLGFTQQTYTDLLESLTPIAISPTMNDDDSVAELPVETRCKRGDIWQLGEHRVACMDALSISTYVHLLKYVNPDVIIADPPYGMRLDAKWGDIKAGEKFAQENNIKGRHNYAPIEGDDKDFDASFIIKHFSGVQEQFWFGADYYAGTLGNTMHSGSWLVWDKRLEESLDTAFGSCFELIWSKRKHKRDALRHKWSGIFGTEHELQGQRKRVHPNQKPVRLLEDIITRYTSVGQVILDPFLGSGPTLVAAQRTGRICYGCEIVPEFVDVILTRWEAETGQTAILAEQVVIPDVAVDVSGDVTIEVNPAQTRVKSGDLWQLGSHYLYVGDSTSQLDVDTLLGVSKVNVVVTSPPYASQRRYDEASEFVPVASEHYGAWFEKVQALLAERLAPDGSFFLNIKEHSEDNIKHIYVKELVVALVKQWGWKYLDELCWTHPGFPGAWPNHFKNAWEPVYHFARQVNIKFRPLAVSTMGESALRYNPALESVATRGTPDAYGSEYSKQVGNKGEVGLVYPSNVLDMVTGGGRVTGEHPAEYPVALPEFFIKAYSDVGDRIYDPFSGSGATLIASERQRRICYAMEISPKYVELTLRRWETETGGQARRVA